MTGTLPLVANVSLLFTEVPYLHRFQRAADAGFSRVETWWPWPVAVPEESDVDAFAAALADAGTSLTGLNLFAGDMPGGERGIVSNPRRRDEFSANLDLVATIAERTGCRAFNALYGQRHADPAAEDAVARENLAQATRRLGDLGGTVLVEPLGRGLNGAYPLETAADAVAVVEEVRATTGSAAIGLLFDTFHLATSGDDLNGVAAAHAGLIAHVQLADSPGRGEPGTGGVDFAGALETLWQHGYRGTVACEYKPTTVTEDSFGWLAGLPRLSR
ncbi:TIM barrel protein [Amycolatopsis sp. NPDC048633]|uniref:hydroxypyruvate isomerase family protein n=1 Tax=Amycolatopsis sp. NPDC048633 TaxID=3157095 RepID=UPI0033D35076